MRKNQFANVNNSREGDQTEIMKEIVDAQHCPFCEENLRKYHKEPILKEGKYWLVTKNQWPYKFTKNHFLLIYKEHAVSLQDLEPEAGAELFALAKELEKEYDIKGGGLSMRFGDTDYSAGTVNHVHVQFIEPDIMAKDFDPVRIKIGLQWEKRKA